MGLKHCIGGGTISKTCASNVMGLKHLIGGGAIIKTCVMQYYEFALLHRWRKKK